MHNISDFVPCFDIPLLLKTLNCVETWNLTHATSESVCTLWIHFICFRKQLIWLFSADISLETLTRQSCCKLLNTATNWLATIIGGLPLEIAAELRSYFREKCCSLVISKFSWDRTQPIINQGFRPVVGCRLAFYIYENDSTVVIDVRNRIKLMVGVNRYVILEEVWTLVHLKHPPDLPPWRHPKPTSVAVKPEFRHLSTRARPKISSVILVLVWSSPSFLSL